MWNAADRPGRCWWALGGIALVTLAGCRGGGGADYARPMPDGLERGEVLNIQAFRNVTRLELTNTTARSFEGGTIWINQRYSRPIGDLGVGESLDLSLREFVDEHGDTFRAGGFFATRDPLPVVLAEFESEGVLYGLLMGGNRIK